MSKVHALIKNAKCPTMHFMPVKLHTATRSKISVCYRFLPKNPDQWWRHELGEVDLLPETACIVADCTTL